MSPHLTESQVRGYRAGELPPEDRLRHDDHLADCADCRDRLLDGEALRSGLASLRTSLAAELAVPAPHVAFETLASYVDGEIGPVERELLEEHLEACPSCAGELQDLQGLKRKLTLHSSVPAIRGLEARKTPRGAGTWLHYAVGAAAMVLVLAVGWVTTRSFRGVDSPSNEVEAPGRAADATLSPSPSALSRRAGDVPEAPPAAGVEVSLREATGLVVLDTQGRLFGLGPLPPAREDSVRRALHTGEVRVPAAVVALGGRRRLRLRGGDQPAVFAVEAPVGTAVESVRPRFRWQPLAGADSYQVKVYDAHLNEVATSARLSVTEWTSTVSLRPGTSFAWEVTAHANGRTVTAPAAPDPEARFLVLDEDQGREVARARTRHRSHLLLGILYAEAGLLDEAERELDTLRVLNTGSEIPERLLRSLRQAAEAKPSR